MTGPEHYREAQRLLDTMIANGRVSSADLILKVAQVHAMLAVTAAIAEMDVYVGGESGAATGRSEKRAKAWTEAMAP